MQLWTLVFIVSYIHSVIIYFSVNKDHHLNILSHVFDFDGSLWYVSTNLACKNTFTCATDSLFDRKSGRATSRVWRRKEEVTPSPFLSAGYCRPPAFPSSSGWHTFVNFDISNGYILLTIGSIYTKLGDFVKLGLHFD